MIDYTYALREYINLEKRALEDLPKEEISVVMNVLEEARETGKRIFVCGNGGSASTASHMVCDFNKGISLKQIVKYDVECLSDNVAMMMAIANDIAYDDVFIVPLQNKLKEGDLVIGISGSGNSENLIRAFDYARKKGAKTIAFTGYSGGNLRRMADYSIHIPVDNMQIVEDVHLMLNHMMMYVLVNSRGDVCRS